MEDKGNKIEVYFGLVLMLAVVAALVFTFFKANAQNDAGLPIGSGKGNLASTQGTVGTGGVPSSLQLSGDFRSDLCSCYQQAFVYSSQGYGVDSTFYETGYSACSSSQGEWGANAWATGWSNGIGGKASQASCKIYLSSVK